MTWILLLAALSGSLELGRFLSGLLFFFARSFGCYTLAATPWPWRPAFAALPDHRAEHRYSSRCSMLVILSCIVAARLTFWHLPDAVSAIRAS